jgi:hypothetical protein
MAFEQGCAVQQNFFLSKKKKKKKKTWEYNPTELRSHTGAMSRCRVGGAMREQGMGVSESDMAIHMTAYVPCTTSMITFE